VDAAATADTVKGSKEGSIRDQSCRADTHGGCADRIYPWKLKDGHYVGPILTPASRVVQFNHWMRLQAVTDEYVIVDDPSGGRG